MGVGPAIFETAGKRTEHFVPGVYSRSNNISSPSGVSSGNLVILGKSQGGKPQELLSFSNLSEARDVLIKGELLDAIGYAFNGSANYIPQQVYAMRVNEATQATLTLKKGVTDVLKLTSWDYGNHCNSLKIWLQNGTKENSKKLTISYKTDVSETDNIEKKSISIVYTGAGTNPTTSIANGKLVLSAKDEETNVIDNFEYDLLSYEALSDLAMAINDTSVYVCSVLDAKDGKPKDLDSVSGVDITSNTNFYSTFAEIVDVLEKSVYIDKVEILSDNIMPDTSSVYQYFTGGKSGDYSLLQWISALSLLETEDVQIIATPSTDENVQSLIVSHCNNMSSTENKKERTCILGGNIGQSDETSLEIARGFNSKYASYVPDSAIVYNPVSGSKEEISGAMLGCMLAGIEAAMAINEPLTNKPINVISFGKKRTLSNLTELIKGGLLVCNPNPQNARELVCIRGLTTFQGNDDLISCERSMVREDIYMNREFRSKFTSVIGKPGTISEADIIQTLISSARDWATKGYIVPKGSDNVWDIHTKINGDKYFISFSRYLTAPVNFMFITATNYVYSSTIQL